MASILPPGQQLAAPGKWPTVGEPEPSDANSPWKLTLQGCVARPMTWSLEELPTLPQVRQPVDIHCVTRWSKLNVPFQGVLLATLVELAQATPEAKFVSFVARSERKHSSSLPLPDAVALGALIALEAEGEPLPLSRGGPIRLVTPGRYFYKSVKWLETIEVLEEDRLGYWEAEAGYHNTADPLLEQRYIAAKLTKQEAAKLIASRDFRGRDLLGIDVARRELIGLVAGNALLRNADFRKTQLQGADFRGANLANARLQGANLADATFADADVEGANFCAANLQGVNFRGASLFGATFFDPDDAENTPAQLSPQTRFLPQQLDALAPEQRRFLAKQLGPTSGSA